MTVDLVAQDRRAQRLRLLGSVFNKINRIMMRDRKIEVLFTESAIPYPGWSSYPSIFINTRHFSDMGNPRTMVQLLGLNYHELGHLMFTPRGLFHVDRKRQGSDKDGSPIFVDMDPILPLELKHAWNILEDQRMESLFTAEYKPAGKYFTELMVRFMVDDQSTWTSAFALTYGRSYLPLEIRQEFEARFAMPNEIEDFKDCIDRYKGFRAFHFRSKTKVVRAVVQEFHDLLERLNARVPQMPGDPCNQAESGGSASSQVEELMKVDEEREREVQNKERRQREKEERTGEDQSGFWEDEEEDEEDDGEDAAGESPVDEEDADGDEDSGDSGGAGSDDEGDSGEEDDDDGDDSGEMPDPDDASGSDSRGDDSDNDDDEGFESGDESVDSDSDESASGGAGEGDGTLEPEFEDEELKDYLKEIEEAVNQDEAVTNEIRQILATMNDPSNTDVIDFPDVVKTLDKEPVTSGMSASVRRMQENLRQLYADIDPGWNYGSDVGRLNINRAMQDPENYEEMFDEWDEGREHETGLEVVILLDISGSMMTNYNMPEVKNPETGKMEKPDPLIVPASKALWCIKASLDYVDAKTTVLGFGSGLVGLISREDKVSNHEYQVLAVSGGGTMPAQALHVSRRLLALSENPNKLLVIITDGEWSEYDVTSPDRKADLAHLIDEINAVKMYVGLGSKANNQAAQKKCDVYRKFENPMDLVPIVQAIVLKLIGSSRR
jgi:hypothetical protein